MKGFTDELNYVVELLEGRTTLEDVIDNHIYEQALVSEIYPLCCLVECLVRNVTILLTLLLSNLLRIKPVGTSRFEIVFASCIIHSTFAGVELQRMEKKSFHCNEMYYLYQCGQIIKYSTLCKSSCH